jgi:hypothetical protein
VVPSCCARRLKKLGLPPLLPALVGRPVALTLTEPPGRRRGPVDLIDVPGLHTV